MVNKVINDHLYVVQLAPGVEKVVNISKMKHFQRNKYNEGKYPVIGNPSVTNPPAQRETQREHPESYDDNSDSEGELMVTQSVPIRRQSKRPESVPKSGTPCNNQGPLRQFQSSSSPAGPTPRDEEEQNVQLDDEESISPLEDSLSPVRLAGSPNSTPSRESPDPLSESRSGAETSEVESPAHRYQLRDRTKISVPERYS